MSYFKQAVFLSLASLLLTNIISAEEKIKEAEWTKDLVTQLEIAQGYRHDKLHKGVKGDHANIKTKFKDIHIYETRLNSQISWKGYFACAKFGYGNIIWGRNHTRANVHAHGERQEFFHSRSHVDGNHTIDTQVSIGKDFTCDSLTLSPLVGYTYDTQDIHMKRNHLHRIFGQRVRARMHHTHLKSRDYWNAPLVGLRASYTVKDLTFYGEYDFLFALKHTGHLSVKTKHASKEIFHQSSKRRKGFGNLLTAGVGYTILENLDFKAEYQFSRLDARGGNAHAKSRHNPNVHSKKAVLISQEVRLVVTYYF